MEKTWAGNIKIAKRILKKMFEQPKDREKIYSVQIDGQRIDFTMELLDKIKNGQERGEEIKKVYHLITKDGRIDISDAGIQHAISKQYISRTADPGKTKRLIDYPKGGLTTYRKSEQTEDVGKGKTRGIAERVSDTIARSPIGPAIGDIDRISRGLGRRLGYKYTNRPLSQYVKEVRSRKSAQTEDVEKGKTYEHKGETIKPYSARDYEVAQTYNKVPKGAKGPIASANRAINRFTERLAERARTQASSPSAITSPKRIKTGPGYGVRKTEDTEKRKNKGFAGLVYRLKSTQTEDVEKGKIGTALRGAKRLVQGIQTRYQLGRIEAKMNRYIKEGTFPATRPTPKKYVSVEDVEKGKIGGARRIARYFNQTLPRAIRRGARQGYTQRAGLRTGTTLTTKEKTEAYRRLKNVGTKAQRVGAVSAGTVGGTLLGAKLRESKKMLKGPQGTSYRDIASSRDAGKVALQARSARKQQYKEQFEGSVGSYGQLRSKKPATVSTVRPGTFKLPKGRGYVTDVGSKQSRIRLSISEGNLSKGKLVAVARAAERLGQKLKPGLQRVISDVKRTIAKPKPKYYRSKPTTTVTSSTKAPVAVKPAGRARRVLGRIRSLKAGKQLAERAAVLGTAGGFAAGMAASASKKPKRRGSGITYTPPSR